MFDKYIDDEPDHQICQLINKTGILAVSLAPDRIYLTFRFNDKPEAIRKEILLDEAMTEVVVEELGSAEWYEDDEQD